jgi:hypothetical protein
MKKIRKYIEQLEEEIELVEKQISMLFEGDPKRIALEKKLERLNVRLEDASDDESLARADRIAHDLYGGWRD